MEIQFIRKTISLPMGLTLAILYLFLWPVLPAHSTSSVLHVAPGSGCSGIPNCYATIQAAIDAAVAGDEVRIAEGTYSDIHSRPRNDTSTTGDVNQVVYLTKTLTIRGGYNDSFTSRDPAVYVTTVDAQGNGRGMYITGNISPTVEGLSITGGDATGLTGYDYYGQYDAGGGVYIMTANATLHENKIFNNFSRYGGGVYLGSTDSQLNNNTISGNSATNGAGGFLYNDSATLVGNTITSNASSNLGGGLFMFDSSATVSSNTIADNTATAQGGGIDVASCDPDFNSNLITGNTADKGGGVYLWYSNSILTNNVVSDNHAGTAGSGLWIGGSQPQLLQTTIAHNTSGDGSGVFSTDNGNTTNPTYSTVTMKNTILVNQTVGIIASSGSTANVEGILWFQNGDNTSGAGTISVSDSFTGDPAFKADGYHLTAGSVAINKGVNADVTTDIDGQPRIGIPDLGADEIPNYGFLPSIYLQLLLNH